MTTNNIFDYEYRKNNYVCKYDIISKLNEFHSNKESYEKFWKWHDKEYDESYYEPSRKELVELIIYLINCDWRYILSTYNSAIKNYPNCKNILSVDNDKKILENVLCELFAEWDDLYVIPN